MTHVDSMECSVLGQGDSMPGVFPEEEKGQVVGLKYVREWTDFLTAA